MSQHFSPEVASFPAPAQPPEIFSRLAEENLRLRAEIQQLRSDRETLKQTVGIMIEMGAWPLG